MSISLKKDKSLIDVIESRPAEKEELLLKNQRTSLYLNHTKNYTTCTVVGLVLNVALLLYSHFGVSAIIKSSVCSSSFSNDCNIDSGPDTGDFTDINVCTNNTHDAAILVPGNPAFDTFADYMAQYGRSCSLGTEPRTIPSVSCMQEVVFRDFNLSFECGLCFEQQIQCSQEFCIKKCLTPPPPTPECVDCSNQFCTPRFEECSGVDITDDARLLLARATAASDFFKNDGQCIDKDSEDFTLTLFDVFKLTYFNSVSKAWTGGSQGLAVLVVVASGIWPYLKNILMALCWFKTMTNYQRETTLRLLAVLGKWSFVDVFAVVLIMNGVRIDKVLGEVPFSPLIVFAESRLAIYAFGIAAIWALIQGEYMRHLARAHKRKSQQGVDNAEETKVAPQKGEHYISEGEDKKLEEDLTPRDLNVIRGAKVGLGIFSLAALVLGIVGTSLIDLDFTMSGLITGFEGPDFFEYSTFDIAFGIIDSCSIYKGHGSVPGTYFLSLIFFFMCALVPFLTYLLFFILAFRFSTEYVKGMKRDNALSFVLGLSNFAAMDVYFLSLLTLISQFEGLIDSAIGNSIDDECGVDPNDPNDFCLKFVGKLRPGAWYILGSVGCFWASQLCVTIMIAKAEKTRIVY